MAGPKGYTVKVNRTETVAAALPLQEHWLPLSNLDLLLPPLDFTIFFCYKPTTKQSFPAKVSALKSSLARTLVAYYALAGEVVPNPSAEPELLCNNRGVDFVEATANISLADLNLHDPDESVEAKLTPNKKSGVLCVQATELACGGLVLACTFDHRVADAYSANMFLVSWAASASASEKAKSLAPTFRRSLLAPRRQGFDPSFDRLYMPISLLPLPSSLPTEKLINRIYYIASADIDKIQASACGARRRSSKLEAFVGFLWRVIGKGTVNGENCSMGVVVDGRSRIESGGSMSSYFGNVLSIPYGTFSAAELAGMTMAEAAEAVGEFVGPAATEGHFRGLVEWVEAIRPEAAVAGIYGGGGGEVAVVVSSGRRFPVGEMEFGWGRPVFGSYHFPWGGTAGYVMPMPSPRGDGDWVVYVHLARTLVDALDAEVGDVFRPITPEYLELND